MGRFIEGFIIACIAAVVAAIFAHTMAARTIEPGDWVKAESLCRQNGGVRNIRLGDGLPETRCDNGAQFVIKEQPHE